jgi:hypothetical protein
MADDTTATALALANALELTPEDIKDTLPYIQGTDGERWLRLAVDLLLMAKLAQKRDLRDAKLVEDYERTLRTAIAKAKEAGGSIDLSLLAAPQHDPKWMQVQLKALNSLLRVYEVQLRWGNPGGKRAPFGGEAAEHHRDRTIQEAADRRRAAKDRFRSAVRTITIDQRTEETSNGETPEA